MIARFRNFYNVKKNSQGLVEKGAVRFEQLQRFTSAKNILGLGALKVT